MNATISRGLGGADRARRDDRGARINVSRGHRPVERRGQNRAASERPLYALSQVFVVQPLAVPTGSAIIPAGLSAGDRFRLLFLSSGTREATSSEIEDYNSFIQVRPRPPATAGIQGFAGRLPRGRLNGRRTNARENTWTTGEGVPVYWLGGGRLADDYPDFHDGSWDARDAARPTRRAVRARISPRTPTRPGRAATTTARRRSAATAPTVWAATRARAR